MRGEVNSLLFSQKEKRNKFPRYIEVSPLSQFVFKTLGEIIIFVLLMAHYSF